MVKVTDCGCCDCNCDDAQLRETIKERALSSINKIYTFDNKTYWPDGTGMVTIPLPTQEQLNKIEDIGNLSDQVDKNTAGLNTANELIAGEQTQIDSLKTTLETSYQAIVQKGSANGYAGLDNNARVPLAQLYAGTSANQVPLIGKQLLANEMLVVDADGLTVRSKPIVQTLSFRGIYPSKAALPSEGNVSGDYAIVSDGTAQADTGYYVWGYNTATSEYEWVWTILFDANSYQLISNLVTVINESSDDSHYPSAKAVKDYHDASIGTVEQEITDINNDLATVQTTLNEHTTGIANAISQAQAAQTAANGCYDDVSIADNVLTFTTASGVTKEIALPSRTTELYNYIDLSGEFEYTYKPGDSAVYSTQQRRQSWNDAPVIYVAEKIESDYEYNRCTTLPVVCTHRFNASLSTGEYLYVESRVTIPDDLKKIILDLLQKSKIVIDDNKTFIILALTLITENNGIYRKFTSFQMNYDNTNGWQFNTDTMSTYSLTKDETVYNFKMEIYGLMLK